MLKHELKRLVIECKEHGEVEVEYKHLDANGGDPDDGFGAEVKLWFTCPECGAYDSVTAS